MTRIFTPVFLLSLFLSATICATAQTTYYVSAANGNDAANGTAASTPFKTLQKAIAAMTANTAAPEINILVEGGVYKPTDGLANAGDRAVSFNLFRLFGTYGNDEALATGKKLRVEGGYNFTTGQRDFIHNPTYLDGDIGEAGNNADNSYHVAIVASALATQDSTIVDGFQIRNGYADGGNGGYVSIHPNLALSTYYGGGIVLSVNFNAKIAVQNCVLSNNGTTGGGGAIYNSSTALSTFRNCVVANNRSFNVGGGLLNEGQGSSVVLINSLFTGNQAPFGAAAYENSANGLNLINCTVAGNTSGNNPAVLYLASGSMSVSNAIIWGNTGSFDVNSGALGVSHSDVQTAVSGDGNISANPQFANSANAAGTDGLWMTADDGFQIAGCSPAKDTGSNDLLPAGIAVDLKFSPRIENAIVDMGAYEAKTPPATGTAYRDADGDTYGTASDTKLYSCSLPPGYVARAGDCDDGNPAINPGAKEICGNGIDDNCDGNVDDNCGLTVNIEDGGVFESNKGTVKLYLRVYLSEPTTGKYSVSYVTRDGTARAGSDYKKAKGTLSFSKGQTSKLIALTVYSDNVVEGQEYLEVVLQNPKGVNIGTGVAKGYIYDYNGAKTTIASEASGKLETPVVEKRLAVPNVLHRNEQWRIPSLPSNNQVMVMDVNGRVIMQARNYGNGRSFSSAATGMYFYQIQTTDSNGKPKLYKGKLLITD